MEQVKVGHDKGIINKTGGLVEKSKKTKMGFLGFLPGLNREDDRGMHLGL